MNFQYCAECGRWHQGASKMGLERRFETVPKWVGSITDTGFDTSVIRFERRAYYNGKEF